MDIRTYDAVRAENERLTHELDLRIRQIMDVSRNYGQLLAANEELRDSAAELGKALDMALAERDELRTELLGTQNARDFLRASLHTERIMHNAELDTMRAKLADMQMAYNLCDALRVDAERELDAMRQAHSVIAARMEAMGC